MTEQSLCVVTATTNWDRAEACIDSWRTQASGDLAVIVVVNGVADADRRPPPTKAGVEYWIPGPNYLGTVPAFKQGTDRALDRGFEIIANLHDDLEIHEGGWDLKVIKHFVRHPACGLLGFGGAIGLGAEGMYDRPYDPMSLARVGFRSNLVDAEAHGLRSLLPERVACLDGFSQVGRREFWLGEKPLRSHDQGYPEKGFPRPWTFLDDIGFVHHFYDGALGALAARRGWETWYLPLRATHYGGRTAVGDQGYQRWAQTQQEKGDEGFWETAHKIGYSAFKDVLPLRV